MTREAWDGLTPKGRWDIIVAQRGPDSKGGDVIKWFTTSVIRSEVGQILRAWGGSALVNDDLKAIILPDGALPGKKGIDGFDWQHFLEHIHSAANYLRLPVGTIPADRFYEAVNTHNLFQAAEIMAKGFSPDLVSSGYKPFVEFIRHKDQFLKPRYDASYKQTLYGLSDSYTSKSFGAE